MCSILRHTVFSNLIVLVQRRLSILIYSIVVGCRLRILFSALFTHKIDMLLCALVLECGACVESVASRFSVHATVTFLSCFGGKEFCFSLPFSTNHYNAELQIKGGCVKRSQLFLWHLILTGKLEKHISEMTHQ